MPGPIFRAMGVLLAIAFSVGGAQVAVAQKTPEIFQSGKGQHGADLAVGGFDSVAYHTEKKPVLGTPEFRVSWKGAEWRFASKANLDLFVASPEKYAPQFGGYCAFAVANGSTAPGDPKLWNVVNGKLYLNVSPGIQSTWVKDQATLIPRGEQNWPRIIGK